MINTKYYRYLKKPQNKEISKEAVLNSKFLLSVNSLYILFVSIINIFISSIFFLLDGIFSFIFTKKFNQKFLTDKIFFKTAKSKIETTYENNDKTLEKIKNSLERNSKYIIAIQGQASTLRIKKDNKDYENNYELSLARALNIKEALIQKLASKNVNIKFILSAIATENSDNKEESQKAEITIYKWKNLDKPEEKELIIREYFTQIYEKIKKKLFE